MFDTQVVQMAFRGLLLILLLSGPPVLISMCLGLGVAIFQTATQIQEQTVSTVVKLISVTLVLIVLGPWLGGTIYSFAMTIFTGFPRWVN